MANCCTFSMKIRGTEDGCRSFLGALKQDGKVYMGRGAAVEVIDAYENEGRFYMQIDGCCKWSIGSALIDNALSMRNNRERWYFDEVDSSQLEFITLDEACSKYGVDCEVFSEEAGIGFQEHILIMDGAVVTDDCVDYCEICPENYDSREEAEEALGRHISDKEWEYRDCYISHGGFIWDFEF